MSSTKPVTVTPGVRSARRVSAGEGSRPTIIETACRAAADLVGDCFGRLDGLIHCAAFAPFLSRIDDYDASEWERTLRINLSFPFLLTQACLPLLRRANDAVVLFTSDSVGRKGRAYWGAYAAAKGGIERFMEVLAHELEGSTGIRVNSLDPGPTRTNLRAHAYPGEDPSSVKPPEDLIPFYLWAMNPACPCATGLTLSYDDMSHLP